MQIGKY